MFSRRKAMGALTGGIMAAPSAAKAVLQQGRNTDPSPSRYMGAGVECDNSKMNSIEGMLDKAAHQKQWLSERIAKLRKIISGEFEEWQLHELENNEMAWQNKTSQRIDGLKSVSQTHKTQMAQDAYKEHRKEQWKENAKKELKSLLLGGDETMKSTLG